MAHDKVCMESNADLSALIDWGWGPGAKERVSDTPSVKLRLCRAPNCCDWLWYEKDVGSEAFADGEFQLSGMYSTLTPHGREDHVFMSMQVLTPPNTVLSQDMGYAFSRFLHFEGVGVSYLENLYLGYDVHDGKTFLFCSFYYDFTNMIAQLFGSCYMCKE